MVINGLYLDLKQIPRHPVFYKSVVFIEIDIIRKTIIFTDFY